MSAQKSLLKALDRIHGTGNFCAIGSTPFFFPELQVKGVGELGFPLSPSQIRELIQVAEEAPFGKGEKTVLDREVRRCWQLDQSQFSFRSAQWNKYLKTVLEQVCEDLGVVGEVSAHPYKLLIYGKEGHFQAHRDSEKLDAMFGTLIISLPSAYEGGYLLIRHAGEEKKIDFSVNSSWRDFQHVAFFADCEHEVLAVESGYRCCITYNLCLEEGDPRALNLPTSEQAQALYAPLQQLGEKRAGKLTAVLLEHRYTEAHLSFNRLKGDDRARAAALIQAAESSGMRAHLALATHHQMGSLDMDDSDWEHNPDDGTIDEIYEEETSLYMWRDSKDRPVPLGEYQIQMDSILSATPFGEGEPDEKEGEGFTGNAGCTMDYWYHRAAIVLWKTEDEERILCKYNFNCACELFEKLAGKKSKAQREQFQRLGEELVGSISDRLHRLSPYQITDDNALRRMLRGIIRTKSLPLLQLLLARIEWPDWRCCSLELWKKLHSTFGVEIFADLYLTLLKKDPANQRALYFTILQSLVTRTDADDFARKFAIALAALPPAEPQYGYFRTRGKMEIVEPREEVKILLAASPLLTKKKDRDTAKTFLLRDADLPHLRDTLVPELLAAGRKKIPENSLFFELQAVALNKLEEEVAQSLEPFPDWTRPCPPIPEEPEDRWGYARKRNQALQELAEFMADPHREMHDFRYAQEIRDILKGFISKHYLDLSTRTLKNGSPHGLQCAKNDNSYQRAAKQREADATMLKKLQAL